MAKSKINRGRSRREELRQDAAHRAEARASRSNSEQIELLDSRLGKGAGASRERERLAEELEKVSREKGEKKSRSKSSVKSGKQKREKRADKR